MFSRAIRLIHIIKNILMVGSKIIGNNFVKYY
jgi:hypothetical protein